MAIDRLYRRREQDYIKADIERTIISLSQVKPQARHYFRAKAEEFGLFERVLNQFKGYSANLMTAEALTTNEEIAQLFLVSRSSVSRYLEQKAQTNEEHEYLRNRESILRAAGGSRGGKNGDKAGNFKSTRTS